MNKKVLVTGKPLSGTAMELAASAGAQILSIKPYMPHEELRGLVASEQPDALIVRQGMISEDIIAASPNLRVIAKHGVGYDNIDVGAATKRAIPVLIAGGANAQSVAEQALALIFAVTKSTAYLDRRVREGHWDKADFVGSELLGKHLGIIGLGSIGRTLVELVAPFKMTVRIYDPYLAPGDTALNAQIVKNLAELLRASDIVSLHCPSTPETKGLIRSEQLALMKPTAILVNTARGDVVDQEALIAALQEGRLAGAGLDTFEHEPLEKNSPLRDLQNVVLNPHVGANSIEAGERVGISALRQVLDVLDGKQPSKPYLINPSVVDVVRGPAIAH